MFNLPIYLKELVSVRAAFLGREFRPLLIQSRVGASEDRVLVSDGGRVDGVVAESISSEPVRTRLRKNLVQRRGHVGKLVFSTLKKILVIITNYLCIMVIHVT